MADDARVEGEAGVIAMLAPLSAGFPGALGLQDDCAVLAPPPGEEIVLKTDAVAAGVHFLPEDDAADIGWKALAVNVSDLAAKGARPLAYLMSLSFPEMPTRAWLTRFAAGLAEAQAAFAIQLAGGDTDRRPGPITVTIAALGAVPAGRMVRRAAARPGDRLFVTDTLGDSAFGLRLLCEPVLAARWGLSGDDVQHLHARYRRPQPRLGLRAALLGHARACMDLSDGLAKDLGRMVKACDAGATVDTSRLPLSDAARKAVSAEPDRLAEVVAGGDDYELLVAVAPEMAADFCAVAVAGGVAVSEIGAIEQAPGARFVGPAGRSLDLVRTGWDHF